MYVIFIPAMALATESLTSNPLLMTGHALFEGYLPTCNYLIKIIKIPKKNQPASYTP